MYFAYGKAEINALSAKDPKLAAVIAQVGMVQREVDTDLFSAVVHHIIGQQISTKAQATIWRRMREALGTVDTMQITYAARNSDFDGYDIHEGDYLALYGSQLFGTSRDIKVLLKSLAEKVRDEGKEYVTIYYGEDVKEKHAQKAADIFADICPNADVNLLSGGQPVYYYLISAE